ncbi:MAG: DNA-protecting protein DprA [Alphaproteobacteria bacterium]|nr:DNA-protecting protein DprA [Alphaproteobacteria bacterium]MBM3624069.1 DNA-protecting protein DprA [Alphaproteobacteria bacterium]
MSETSPAGRLSEEQLVDWLRLIRSENIGPRTFRQLINRFGGAGAALEALPSLAARSLRGRTIRIATRDDALREVEASRALGVRFVSTGDPDYPPLLKEIADAPPLIATRGVSWAGQRDSVAIVGSRNASAAGLTFAERLARSLALENYVIVSGLARGIDAVAHRAALETGTIAVLAGGHARPYPSEHARLVEEIAERGLIVSEMPLEWEPRGRDFPRRNRIISGLSRATIVVEAARRSGSLITARFANEQGREVFAVPGSPLDPRAEGVNDLIRQGATLCARPEDVISVLAENAGAPTRKDLFDDDALGGEETLIDELDLFSDLDDSAFEERAVATRFSASKPPADCRPDIDARMQGEAPLRADAHEIVVSLLGPAPVSVDDLIRVAGLTAREVQGVLVELDVEGRLQRHGANRVSLVYNQKV